MPPGAGQRGEQEPDDDLGDLLGGGGLRQRHPAVQDGALGESYSRDGRPQRCVARTPPRTTTACAAAPRPRLAAPALARSCRPASTSAPSSAAASLQPAIFPEIGNPNPFDEPGRPDIRVSDRGRGTGAAGEPGGDQPAQDAASTTRTSPSSAPTTTPATTAPAAAAACHVMYANDRDASTPALGRVRPPGRSATRRPDDPQGRARATRSSHRFTRAIPTSQCMSCHMHQPNSFVNTYLGYTMWDYETDGELLWPEEQRTPPPPSARQPRPQPRRRRGARAVDRPRVPRQRLAS